MAKLTAVGAYIFAGGFTLGVRRHFKVLAHFEDGSYGVETFKRNQPGIPVYTDPVNWPMTRRWKVDFVYANPPCAPWSLAGVRRKGEMAKINDTRWQHDPRVACVNKAFGVLEIMRPTVWAWESVQGAFFKGRSFVDELTERAHRLGYAVTYVLIEGSRLGLPSRRPRFFMLAHKVALDFQEVEDNFVTVRQALRGKKTKPLPRSNMGTIDKPLLRHAKQGERLRIAFDRRNPDADKKQRVHTPQGYIVRGRPSFLKIRLDWNKVAPVLTGGATHIHPEQDRYLSVSECGVLLGYPPDYEFAGAVSIQYRQLAQCVTPTVGEWLAREMARNIKRGKAAKKGTTRLVDLRRKPMNVIDDPIA